MGETVVYTRSRPVGDAVANERGVNGSSCGDWWVLVATGDFKSILLHTGHSTYTSKKLVGI